jgi:two-component system sensor histidine kinase CiaH
MIEQIAHFWQSQTVRLAGVYIAIIMLMSVSFSVAIFSVSASHIERQIPEELVRDDAGQFGPPQRVIRYIEQQSQASKTDLATQLTLFNLLVLVFGAALSFVLARWTLEPIERSVAAQTRFVSDASHELRTPLTTIQTTNEVALRRKNLSVRDARDVLENNLVDVRRLQRMINKLLQIVASDTINLTLLPTHLDQIVQLAVNDTSAQAEAKHIAISTNIEHDTMVLADLESAAQALTVLLDNAIKYSSEQSTVTIRQRKVRRTHLAIDVIDLGGGIAKADQKQIFDRFYRTDEARTDNGNGGFGLGLGIAQRIAKAHGGTIEVKSQLKKGSTFSFVVSRAK